MFKKKKCIIKKGKKFYIDEFVDFFNKNKLTLKIIDIFLGKEKILLFGELSHSTRYGNYFYFTINSTNIIYQFY